MLFWKYSCFDKKFVSSDRCSDIRRKKLHGCKFQRQKNLQYRRINGWLRVFYINNFSTFEKMHSLNQLFLEISIELLEEILKQWKSVSSPIKLNTEPFNGWMTTIHSVTKLDTLLRRMDDCNESSERNKLPLKKTNA